MAEVTNSRTGRLSIGALAQQTGVNAETIRYYERAGIMPKPPRSKGGYRLYEAGHAKRLSFVRRARELGFSLDEVRALLALVDGQHGTCAEVRALTLAHLESVRQRIADLRRLEITLDGIVRKCRGGRVPECPVIDALGSAL